MKGDTSRRGLQVYEDDVNRELSGSMRKSYMYQRLLEHFPGAIDLLIRRANSTSGLAEIFINKL